jgi:hypothetical protein
VLPLRNVPVELEAVDDLLAPADSDSITDAGYGVLQGPARIAAVLLDHMKILANPGARGIGIQVEVTAAVPHPDPRHTSMTLGIADMIVERLVQPRLEDVVELLPAECRFAGILR